MFQLYLIRHPRTYWWDWLPEALMNLRFCTGRSHRITPYYIAFKQDPRPPYLPVDLDDTHEPLDLCTEALEVTMTKRLVERF